VDPQLAGPAAGEAVHERGVRRAVSGHSDGLRKSISMTVMSRLASTSMIAARTPTLIAARSSADQAPIPCHCPAGSRTSTSGSNSAR
jgi:hypothetical protein